MSCKKTCRVKKSFSLTSVSRFPIPGPLSHVWLSLLSICYHLSLRLLLRFSGFPSWIWGISNICRLHFGLELFESHPFYSLKSRLKLLFSIDTSMDIFWDRLAMVALFRGPKTTLGSLISENDVKVSAQARLRSRSQSPHYPLGKGYAGSGYQVAMIESVVWRPNRL